MSFKTKKEAQKHAEQVLSLMNTEGWKIQVWNNIGWYYSLKVGALSLRKTGDGKYYCLLGNRMNSGGMAFWLDANFYDDPNEAVENQLKVAQNFVDKHQRIIDEVINLLEDRNG